MLLITEVFCNADGTFSIVIFLIEKKLLVGCDNLTPLSQCVIDMVVLTLSGCLMACVMPGVKQQMV